MLIAGIIGQSGITQTANLVNSILSSTGKKVSIIDSKNLMELDSRRIKSYEEELDKNNVDVLILKINVIDIKNKIFESIHFDIIIYTDKADDLNEMKINGNREALGKIFSMLDEKGVAIVNVEDSELVKLLEDMKYHFITYGFNSKASITTSSVGDTDFDDNFMCCLQRTISTRTGSLVEPQEYRLKIEANSLNANNVLAAATFAIVNGVDLNMINHFEAKT